MAVLTSRVYISDKSKVTHDTAYNDPYHSQYFINEFLFTLSFIRGNATANMVAMVQLSGLNTDCSRKVVIPSLLQKLQKCLQRQFNFQSKTMIHWSIYLD